jgi:hypothetical protein
LGWGVIVKCNTIDGWKEGHRNKALSCHSSHEMDMKTLVWTRGAILVTQLSGRLRCPACGNEKVIVLFEVPNEPMAITARNKVEMDSDDPDTGFPW